MNPWQTWLQTFSQSQKSTSASASAFTSQWNNSDWSKQATAQWQSNWQQWQQGMEGAWESPSSYWQAVSSIMSARARTISTFWQQQPQYCAEMFQCTTFPQWVELLTRWSGHNLTSTINLNTTTQAHSSNLFTQWQRQWPYTSAVSPAAVNAFSSMWKSSTTSSTPFTSQPKTQTSGTSARATSGTTSTAQTATPSSQSTWQAAAGNTPQTTQGNTSSSSSAISASVTPSIISTSETNNAQLNLINSTTSITPAASLSGSTSEGTISSTANSVMRSAGGSTIASTAARRSVVARRTANNRRAVR